MRLRYTTKAALAALALVALVGCGGGQVVPPGPPPPARDPAQVAELEALYRARADSARMDFTEADVAFMQGMIGHHAQALVMSGLASTHGAGASVQTLAARTINAQNDEIASMRGWLEDRGQAAPEIHISGTELMLHGVDHDMADMPGMLSDQQMSELDAARGTDFDRLFLTFMIQHHSGAVEMVHRLFATDGAALDDTVFKIASDIQVDQTTEINRMESMLGALPDNP